MKPVSVYFIAAFLFTFLLGYVDEGYYNLKTFESIGNILVLGVYLILFWGTELGFHVLYGKLLPTNPPLQKTVSVILGLFIPITLAMLLAPQS